MALLEFYGRECPHCERMHPLVERLTKEEGVKVEKLEVWHDEANAQKMQEYDRGNCGGVPYFHNTKNKKFICGETGYEELKRWAKE
ncbi:hypothetical protein EPN90_03350 [Patescibacteria group bacterium]|nr:MAG: hypothetical protein EPN90_03350 [Patescibacteria group bacterium]